MQKKTTANREKDNLKEKIPTNPQPEIKKSQKEDSSGKFQNDEVRTSEPAHGGKSHLDKNNPQPRGSQKEPVTSFEEEYE